MNESPHFPISSLAFGIVSVLNFGHSNRYVVIYHCCLFTFPWQNRMQSIFSYPYFPSVYLLWRRSDEAFSLFLISYFLTGEFWLLCILWMTVLDQMFLLENFFSPHSSASLLILLTLSFTKQTFLILIKSSLSVISFMDCAFGVLTISFLLNWDAGY